MIELRTGVNGSGKTLNMVTELAKLYKRWESHPDEVRPVYVWGIRELNFPVLQIPHNMQTIKGIEYPVPLWDEMPDGSLVLIDECQKMFPPRSSQSAPPPHVLWFTEHRRLGFDFWMTTQHPKFIDPMVRALTGKHQHFRRLFGGSRSMIYEWDCSNDSLGNYRGATKTLFPFPRDSFKYYKSAEIHTKQNFRLPLFVFIPIIGLVLGLVFVPRAYSTMFGEHKSATEYIPSEMAKSQGNPQSGEQGGAIAPTAQPLKGFPDVQDGDVNGGVVAVVGQSNGVPLATIERYKLAHGVYSDDEKSPQHFTEEELIRQREAVAVLDRRYR